MSAYFDKCKELQSQLVDDLNILLKNKDRIDAYDAFCKEHGFQLVICPHWHTGACSIVAIGDITPIDDAAFYTERTFNGKRVFDVNGFDVVEK